MDDPLPCPFCGATPVIAYLGAQLIWCQNVECAAYEDEKSTYIIHWNTRPLEYALRTELDACKSVLADAETQRDMNGAEIDTLLKQLDIAINAIKWCIGFFKDSDHEFDEITKVLLTAHAKIDCIGD